MGKINNNALDQIVFDTDLDDDLKLQVNGATSLRINANLALGLGNTTSYGTAGQVLTSNGVATAPYWQSLNFAPLSNPTFTGNVSLTTLSANGSVGTNGQILTSNGSVSYWATPASGGLSVLDSYYLTALANNPSNVALTGWTRDTPTMTALGGGVTNTSGVFSFPSTGYWEITLNVRFYSSLSADYIDIRYSTDSGSTYSVLKRATVPGSIYATAAQVAIARITDISTFRIAIFAKCGQVVQEETNLLFKKLA